LLTLWGPGGAAMASRLGDGDFSVLLVVHVGSTFLAFLFLTVSFGAAVLYLVMARRLKSKRRALLLRGPSLERIDRTLFLTMVVGVALLTLGIGVGAIWAGTRGAPGPIGPKVVATVLAWLLFALVTQIRWVFGWRGQRGAGLVVGSYLWLLVAMLAVRHVA